MRFPLIVEDASSTRWILFPIKYRNCAELTEDAARAGRAGIMALKPDLNLDYLLVRDELAPFVPLELVQCPECKGARSIFTQTALRVAEVGEGGAVLWKIIGHSDASTDDLVPGESLGPGVVPCTNADCLNDGSVLRPRGGVIVNLSRRELVLEIRKHYQAPQEPPQ